MCNEYDHLCNRLKEIAVKQDQEKLDKINAHFEKKNKSFQSIKEFENYSNDLMNKFGINDSKTDNDEQRALDKIKEFIINQYEEVKDGVTVGVVTVKGKPLKFPTIDENYNMNIPPSEMVYKTWLMLIDENNTYDNLLLNISSNKDDANKHFEFLSDLVKNNGLDTISKKILESIEKK